MKLPCQPEMLRRHNPMGRGTTDDKETAPEGTNKLLTQLRPEARRPLVVHPSIEGASPFLGPSASPHSLGIRCSLAITSICSSLQSSSPGQSPVHSPVDLHCKPPTAFPNKRVKEARSLDMNRLH